MGCGQSANVYLHCHFSSGQSISLAVIPLALFKRKHGSNKMSFVAVSKRYSRLYTASTSSTS